MNDMWFGDHPVPSSGAVSPNMPLRLSTIQLQAQAELERRQRSSSRTHSLDRRSGHSGVGTESRLSRAPTEIEGYEGVGYGYDTRGRLIHGGANLHERAASRLDDRKAHLDDSAVAFALRDFTSPGVREYGPEQDLSSEEVTDLSNTVEHIYARPEDLQLRGSSKRIQRSNSGLVHPERTWSVKSLQRFNNPAMQTRLRRPRLTPNRWGSVPLPDSAQYDSLLRLSQLSLGLDDRKAHLDDSAVAFALRDFTSPGVREYGPEQDLSSEEVTDLSNTVEHIYARPESLQLRGSSKRIQRSNSGLVHPERTWSVKSLQRFNNPAMQTRLRRPRLTPNRWGSVPLPDSAQYDSLLRLSQLSLGSRSQRAHTLRERRPDYMLESSV
ncbi:hypothetical protein AHF37_04477 [Paragonimus kellicotti]|nr:hypothetical protein AHF37_04477 [Paragonimus kellicotti]